MNTFTETQQNPYRWYVLVFAVMLPFLISWLNWNLFSNLLAKGEDQILLMALGGYIFFSSMLVSLVIFKKFDTYIDQHGIRFRIGPTGYTQTIRWVEIDRAYIREFALIGEYPQGKGGTRQGPNGWAYVMDGTYGLQIEKKSGGRILIGTQRPDELQAFLQQEALAN